MKLSDKQMQMLEFCERREHTENWNMPSFLAQASFLAQDSLFLDDTGFIEIEPRGIYYVLTFKGHVALAAWREHGKR